MIFRSLPLKVSNGRPQWLPMLNLISLSGEIKMSQRKQIPRDFTKSHSKSSSTKENVSVSTRTYPSNTRHNMSLKSSLKISTELINNISKNTKKLSWSGKIASNCKSSATISGKRSCSKSYQRIQKCTRSVKRWEQRLNSSLRTVSKSQGYKSIEKKFVRSGTSRKSREKRSCWMPIE